MSQLIHGRMPAEWTRHEKTLMEWPVRGAMIWPQNYREACEGYAEVASAISRFEPVAMIVNENEYPDAESLCGAFTELIPIPHNDAWARDNGPTFVWNEKNERVGINWRFNAWGEKYAPYDLDDEAAGKILDYYGIARLDAPIVLEGGSIHVDGEGTLLTTEQCLLHPNRNPELSRAQLEEYLGAYLGVSKVIWLKRGLFGDETDGHIDNVACFAKPGVVLLQSCRDEQDPNSAVTRENLEILCGASDACGRKFEIIEISQPPARYYRGVRLTLSYLNFYLVNGGVILPVFGGDAQEADQNAVNILRRVYPDCEIVPVDGMPLIKEGGNVHCITQQVPEVIRKEQL
ncbi:MAG TPA: agmatine deiminase family protein [Caproiciproducens sp.]|nr:agmatine deiminase family protein [Caproiciproducens sp.]